MKAADGLNEVTVQDIRALRSHGIDLNEIKKAIAETSEISMEKLDALLDDVVERNQKYYRDMIDLAQVTKPERLVDERDIDAIRRQTQNELKNFTQSMGFVLHRGTERVLLPPAKAYQGALDAAELKVMSGAISYNEAISDAVRELAESGLKVVEYESGHHDQIDVAVRRAIMSGVNAINQKYREQSMDYLETDLVETTAHIGARNTGKGYFNHESWQGFVYHWKKYGNQHKGKYPDFEDVCGIGEGGGIGGWNCRHSYWPYIDGVSEPTYSKKELESMKADNHKFEFEGKIYNGYTATQKQRSIERSIREWKRLKISYENAGLEIQATAAKSRLYKREKGLYWEYRAFSKAAGLPEQRDRIKVLYT